MIEAVQRIPGGGFATEIMKKRVVEVKLLHPAISEDDLKPKTPGSAGIDLVALCEDGCEPPDRPVAGYFTIAPAVTLAPGEVKLIRTGISIHIADPGYAGMILPRSGLGHKKGLVLGNLVGLIDSDYQGELKVSAWNRSKETIHIHHTERIAQLVIVPVMVPEFKIVDSFDESTRGEGGFGSTGVSA